MFRHNGVDLEDFIFWVDNILRQSSHWTKSTKTIFQWTLGASMLHISFQIINYADISHQGISRAMARLMIGLFPWQETCRLPWLLVFKSLIKCRHVGTRKRESVNLCECSSNPQQGPMDHWHRCSAAIWWTSAPTIQMLGRALQTWGQYSLTNSLRLCLNKRLVQKYIHVPCKSGTRVEDVEK